MDIIERFFLIVFGFLNILIGIVVGVKSGAPKPLIITGGIAMFLAVMLSLVIFRQGVENS